MSKSTFSIGRRQVLQLGAAGVAASMIPSLAKAADDKIQIGYWPIASGLPFYVALEKGYFKEVGLNVEGVKFASPNQIAEAMIAGRIQGSANGTASAALALQKLAHQISSKLFAPIHLMRNMCLMKYWSQLIAK